MEARREHSKAFKILWKNCFQPRIFNLANYQLNLRVKVFSVMQGLKKFSLPTLSQEAVGGFSPPNGMSKTRKMKIWDTENEGFN